MALHKLAFVSAVLRLALILGLALVFVLPEPEDRARPNKPQGSAEDG